MPAIEVRKIRAGDSKHWTMRHAPGGRSSASYGVYVDGDLVAAISSESRGYRGLTQWHVETVGDWAAPPAQRPKRIYDTDSFEKAKAWAIANAHTLKPATGTTAQRHATKKKTPAQLDREIDEELARARAIWSRSKPVSVPSQAVVEKTDEERKKSGLCTYCGKPTRKGSALIDGWPTHKSCIIEYED